MNFQDHSQGNGNNFYNQTHNLPQFRQKDPLLNQSFTKTKVPLMMKSIHGQRLSPQKDSLHQKQIKVSFQNANNPPESQRAKKEISVNLIDHIINQDDNQVRTNDARKSNNNSGLRQDSLMTDNPMKQRYNVQQSSRSPRKKHFPSDDSIEKLNDIMNLSDELNRIHSLKMKRDQMIVQNQILLDKKQSKEKQGQNSHKWQDTAQILEQLTVSQYSLGRSDAKQQKELQMKLMQNHFTKQEQSKQNVVQRPATKSGFGALTRNNHYLQTQQRNHSVQRTPGQLEYLVDRRQSLMTNGVNIPNNQHPGALMQFAKRSKTPIFDGGLSPRKYQTRMFPPPSKQNTIRNPQGGLNFSFRQSLDMKDMNQDLKSEAINLDHFAKQHTRPHTKEKSQAYQKTQKLQFSKQQYTHNKNSNQNCGTSPMSPSGAIPGFQSSVSNSNEIKVQDEAAEYQMNPNNIYNQLGSKLQSDRSYHQPHTKVIQSQESSTIGSPKVEKDGETVSKVSKNREGKNFANPQGTLVQQPSLDDGQQAVQESYGYEYQKEVKFVSKQPGVSSQFNGSNLQPQNSSQKAHGPVSKTHQISIQTSKVIIDNQVTQGSDEATSVKQEIRHIQPSTRRSKEEEEMKTTLQQESATSKVYQPQLSDEERRQKLLNIMEVTSKTLSNSQSVEGRMNKFIQTQKFDGDSNETRNSRIPNISIKNHNHITFQDQNPSPQAKSKPKSKDIRLFPVNYNFKDYEQEIQKLTGMKRKPMRPIEKRMIATQVFAIQAYDSFSGITSHREDTKNSSRGKTTKQNQPPNQLVQEIEKHVNEMQSKLKITLPLSNQGQNQPTSPADSGIEHNHQISDYGPRLVSTSPTPMHKKSFYEQIQQAFLQKTGKQYKTKAGNGVGIHQKIQKLSRKQDVEKMDAWAAAEILSDFPELAHELLSDEMDGNEGLDETLKGVIKELNRKNLKSPINSSTRDKELNQTKVTSPDRISPDRGQEKGTINSDKQKDVPSSNNIRKNALQVGRRSSSVRMTPAESPKNSRGGETREENELSEAQEELRKITFQIESDEKPNIEKMRKHLQAIFPNRQIDQLSEQQLKILTAKLIQNRPGNKTPDVTSGRRTNNSKLMSSDGTFFNPRRQNQGILKNSTFLPLKDRQAKQQFRIFVQNEKNRVERKTIFEPIKQKQQPIERLEASQELPSGRDQLKRESLAQDSSAPGITQDSGFWSALSHIGPKHPAPIYQNLSRRQVSRRRDSLQKSQSPIRFPPKRGTKSSHRHQRNISQLQHHRNQLQNNVYDQSSPRDGVLQSNGALLNGKEVLYNRHESYSSTDNRSARASTRQNNDRVSPNNADQSSRLTNMQQQANPLVESHASKPSTLLGSVDPRAVSGSAALSVTMKPSQYVSQLSKLEERRQSTESQNNPVSIPKQRKVEDMELLGTKQMLTKRVNMNSSSKQRGETPVSTGIEVTNPLNFESAVTPINIHVGSTQIEVRAPLVGRQTSGNVSPVTRSGQPASFRGGGGSQPADTRNVSQVIQMQLSTQQREDQSQVRANAVHSPITPEEVRPAGQQTGRTRETERVNYKDSQQTIKMESEQYEHGAPVGMTSQGERNRVITSRIHEKVESGKGLDKVQSQEGEQEAASKDMVSDFKSNGEAATSDILSPMQQVQKPSSPTEILQSPAEPLFECDTQPQQQTGPNHRSELPDEGATTGERTTAENVKTMKSDAAMKAFVEDNLIMIIDSPRGGKDETNLQGANNLLDFLDQKFQPAPLSSNQELQVPMPYQRYGAAADNQSYSLIQSGPSGSQGQASPKFIDRTNTAKLQDSYDPTSFQAGSYIKNLKRSVEKPDKKSSKDSQKKDIDLFVQSVNESFQKPSIQVPQIQSKSIHRPINSKQQPVTNISFQPTKKSPSPTHQKGVSAVQHGELTSLGRNQMAVQSIASNMRLQKQQQFQRQLPNLPMVIGTNFNSQISNRHSSLQLQQVNNANFSVINPQAQISQMQSMSYHYMKNTPNAYRNLPPGIDIIEAIGEFNPDIPGKSGESPTVMQHKVQISKPSQNQPGASRDTLLDQIIAQAVVETEKSPAAASSKPPGEFVAEDTPFLKNSGSAIPSVDSVSQAQTPQRISRLPKDFPARAEGVDPIRIENQNN